MTKNYNIILPGGAGLVGQNFDVVTIKNRAY
jgi:hypothetical protein